MDLASDLEESIGELVEAAGGRPGFFRRFVPRGEQDAADTRRDAPDGGPSNNGHGEREESPAG